MKRKKNKTIKLKSDSEICLICGNFVDKKKFKHAFYCNVCNKDVIAEKLSVVLNPESQYSEKDYRDKLNINGFSLLQCRYCKQVYNCLGIKVLLTFKNVSQSQNILMVINEYQTCEGFRRWEL